MMTRAPRQEPTKQPLAPRKDDGCAAHPVRMPCTNRGESRYQRPLPALWPEQSAPSLRTPLSPHRNALTRIFLTLPPGSAHSPDQSFTNSTPPSVGTRQPALRADGSVALLEQGGGASPQAISDKKAVTQRLRLIDPIHRIVTDCDSQLIQQCVTGMDLPGPAKLNRH